jgi:hypothetical protein
MNAKQAKTLKAIFDEPVSASIEWASIENLFVAVGCKIIEGRGSRVKFAHKGLVAFFHRPHPAREAKPYQVRDARKFLEQIGIKP